MLTCLLVVATIELYRPGKGANQVARMLDEGASMRTRGLTWTSNGHGVRTAGPPDCRPIDGFARLLAMLLVAAMVARPWIVEAAAPKEIATDAEQPAVANPWTGTDREILIAGYIGAPFYYRSDVKLRRNDGTDVHLKRLGWDGDALYFPIDGGIRSVEWWGSAGLMIDFLHNKAIARLGRGAHGRRLANPVVEEVEASGTIKGQPAPSPLKLTDLVERFEFTHGHNMLFLTPMLQLGALSPRVRPYVGVGAGFALPHVEVWSPGEDRETRTNEYQLAGPAVQAVAGLELRTGSMSYFLEYKFSAAWISGSLTGTQSWMNFNMPGDLWRQFSRWWRGEPPRYGRFSTRLVAHQPIVGAGYWWNRGPRKP